MGDRGHNRHGPLSPFRGGWSSRLTQCGLGRGLLPYEVASSSIHPLGHNRHGPKTGGCAPLRGAANTTTSNTTLPGPRFTSVPSGHLDSPSRLATIDIGRKLDGGYALFFCGGTGSPSNTKSPGPRPTSIPSGILVHPAVWSQYAWAENCGAPPPFWGRGELGLHLTQCGQGRGLPACRVSS